MIMEPIIGESLTDKLAQMGSFSLAGSLSITLQIARALEDFHAFGLVHGDLTPSKIALLAEFDNELVKVVNFSQITEHQGPMSYIFLSDPWYTPPERFLNQAIEDTADIYSLGVILYICLTGSPPFEVPSSAISSIRKEDRDPLELLFQHQKEIPIALKSLLSQMLAMKPEDRPSTIVKVRRVLESIGKEHKLFPHDADFFQRNTLPPGTIEIDNLSSTSLVPYYPPKKEKEDSSFEKIFTQCSPLLTDKASPKRSCFQSTMKGFVALMLAGALIVVGHYFFTTEMTNPSERQSSRIVRTTKGPNSSKEKTTLRAEHDDPRLPNPSTRYTPMSGNDRQFTTNEDKNEAGTSEDSTLEPKPASKVKTPKKEKKRRLRSRKRSKRKSTRKVRRKRGGKTKSKVVRSSSIKWGRPSGGL
jgi:serine/threonine protein kinase